jgi:Domain of unknown function (DUF1840)
MYKFKSRAAGDLIMLEPNGRQILAIIGKLDSPAAHQGILLPVEMPAAIAALQAAVAEDEARRTQLTQQAQTAGETPPSFSGISLRLRTVPFIEMIQRCHRADKEIVWGV